MTLTRQLSFSLLACLLISTASYAVGEEDPRLLVLVLVATVLGWWVTEARPGRGLPRWMTNIILIGVVIAAVWRASLGGPMVSAFTGFLCALLMVKLWTTRQVRDYGQLLSMTLFLLIGSTLTGTSIGVGLCVLLYLPAIILGITALQALTPLAVVVGWELPPDRLAAAERAGTTRKPARTVFAISTLAVLLSMGISATIFVLVPRGIGVSGMGQFGRAASGSVTGFRDNVQLGRGGLISESQTTVLEATPVPLAGREPLGGVGQVIYLRGAVLDSYARGQWTSSPPLPGDVSRVRPGMGETQSVFENSNPGFSSGLSIAIRRPSDGQPLFTPWRPVSIGFEPSFMLPGTLQIDKRMGVISRISGGSAGELRYLVAHGPDLARDDAKRSTVPAFPSRRVANLAADILRRADIEPDPSLRSIAEDARAVRALVNYLQGFAYTMDITAAPAGEEPTEWFLFVAKEGHCEYFASALAALCRAVGINSRVVTGYMASEFDAARRLYVVRESNAHAWVEAEISGAWRIFDATPPDSLNRLRDLPSGLSARWSRWLDGLNAAWADGIISFDHNSQREILGGSGTLWFDGLAERLRNQSEEATPERARSRTTLILVVSGLLVAGAAVPFLLLRRRKAAAGPERWTGRLGAAYHDLLRALAKAGHPKPDHVPLRMHLGQVAENNPDLAHPALKAADVIYEARFGGGEFTPARLDEVRGLIGSIRPRR